MVLFTSEVLDDHPEISTFAYALLALYQQYLLNPESAEAQLTFMEGADAQIQASLSEMDAKTAAVVKAEINYDFLSLLDDLVEANGLTEELGDIHFLGYMMFGAMTR